MVHKTCSFFPNGEFVRYIGRKYPTCFACVFWSDLEHNLSDIQVGYFRCKYRTNYSPNKLRVHFVRYISRTFPIYISDKLWSKYAQKTWFTKRIVFFQTAPHKSFQVCCHNINTVEIDKLSMILVFFLILKGPNIHHIYSTASVCSYQILRVFSSINIWTLLKAFTGRLSLTFVPN